MGVLNLSAIDQASWWYNFALSDDHVNAIRNSNKAANTTEKNILFTLLRLLKANCQLVVIFDGPKRPEKRGKVVREFSEEKLRLLKSTLSHLGIPWHIAPGEAEAECAALQVQGFVDAVWTEDGDALMFGATTVIRFSWTRKKSEGAKHTGGKANMKKDPDKVRVYRKCDIVKQHPFLERDFRKALVLFAVLSGGDYNQKGVQGCGPESAFEIIANNPNFGTELCGMNKAAMPIWRQKLERYLAKSQAGRRIQLDKDFPNFEQLTQYKTPLVSDTKLFQEILKRWEVPTEIDGPLLWSFLFTRFNFRMEKFIDYIIPILLVRSLVRTEAGKEDISSHLQLTTKKHHSSGQSEVSFLLLDLVTVATIEKDSWLATYGESCEDLPERVNTTILDCIIQHARPGLDSVSSSRTGTKRKTITETSGGVVAKKSRGRPSKHTLLERGSVAAPPTGQLNPTFDPPIPPDYTASFYTRDKPLTNAPSNPILIDELPKGHTLPKSNGEKAASPSRLHKNIEQAAALTPLDQNQLRRSRLSYFEGQKGVSQAMSARVRDFIDLTDD